MVATVTAPCREGIVRTDHRTDQQREEGCMHGQNTNAIAFSSAGTMVHAGGANATMDSIANRVWLSGDSWGRAKRRLRASARPPRPKQKEDVYITAFFDCPKLVFSRLFTILDYIVFYIFIYAVYLSYRNPEKTSTSLRWISYHHKSWETKRGSTSLFWWKYDTHRGVPWGLWNQQKRKKTQSKNRSLGTLWDIFIYDLGYVDISLHQSGRKRTPKARPQHKRDDCEEARRTQTLKPPRETPETTS